MKRFILILAIFSLTNSGFSQNIDSLAELAYSKFEQHDFFESYKLFNKVMEDSLSPSLYCDRSLCCIIIGEANCKADILKADKLAPLDPEIQNNIAFLYGQLGEYERAATHFRRVLDLEENSTHEMYFNIGSYFYFANKLDSAQKYLEIAYEMNSKHLETLTNLGFVALPNDLNKSYNYFSQAYQLDQKDVSNINNLGYVLLLQNKKQKALKLFQKALRLDKENAQTYRLLAYFNMKSNQKEEAQKFLLKSYEYDDPFNPWRPEFFDDLVKYCN
ncbi:MAG: tetratricopeptide repeat protein [Reichenbachiella sp.]